MAGILSELFVPGLTAAKIHIVRRLFVGSVLRDGAEPAHRVIVSGMEDPSSRATMKRIVLSIDSDIIRHHER